VFGTHFTLTHVLVTMVVLGFVIFGALRFKAAWPRPTAAWCRRAA
jgi:hypothetical protein